jgi:hypothetical protein
MARPKRFAPLNFNPSRVCHVLPSHHGSGELSLCECATVNMATTTVLRPFLNRFQVFTTPAGSFLLKCEMGKALGGHS